MEWIPGEPEVRLHAIARFSKGEPITRSYAEFAYSLEERHWRDGGPRGAAREAEKEILRVAAQ